MLSVRDCTNESMRRPPFLSVRICFNPDGRLNINGTGSLLQDNLMSQKRKLILGQGVDIFYQRRSTLEFLLGTPLIFKCGKVYWMSRIRWKNYTRRYSLTEWESHKIDTSTRLRTITFCGEISVSLIPPKEGKDFDIDKQSDITCIDYDKLSSPLIPDEDYREYWTLSPFPQDKGARRPFYHTSKHGTSGWCLCNKPPKKKYGHAISCWKCLNMEHRKLVRKSSPEELQERYMKIISAND